MKISAVVVIASFLLMPLVASARDSVGEYSIEEAMSLEDAKVRLGDEIKFYFGTQSHGKVAKSFGEFKTNKKTNAFNKTDTAACQWAFLSAMIALKERAQREGGNAVIEIKSNYKDNLTSSNDKFVCGAGNVIAGVALVGKVVTIE